MSGTVSTGQLGYKPILDIFWPELTRDMASINADKNIFEGKISQEDYNHTQNVWKEFGCKILGEYNNLYLKIDILSLADV
ncbi:1836_t:CDS:2 [Funneliformis geosporum]|nr:1836_t:CDS:2 [Funneliformis geosporum]